MMTDNERRLVRILDILTSEVRSWAGSRGIRSLDNARQLAELELLKWRCEHCKNDITPENM